MEYSLDTLERARAVFRDAARRAALPVAASTIDALAQRVSLSLSVQLEASSKITKPSSDLVIRPSNMVATELAARTRHLLNANDVDPLLDLPSMVADQLNILIFPVAQKDIAGACALVDGNAF